MSYKIKKLQLQKAKELGVIIKPSTNKNKKIDVYIGDKVVARIGANISMIKGKPMNDYATYLTTDPSIAESRRINYIKRHSKEPKIDNDGKFTKSFYSDEILWGQKGKDVNNVRAFRRYRDKLLLEEEKKKEKLKKLLKKK